jgi:hypothetical protein
VSCVVCADKRGSETLNRLRAQVDARSASQGLQAPASRFKVKRAAHMPDGAVKEEEDGGAAPSLEQFHDWVDQLQFTTGTTTTPSCFGMRSVGSVAAVPRRCNQRTDSAGEKGSSSDGYSDGAGCVNGCSV